MTRSPINTCLFTVISLLVGVIWLSPAITLAAPTILPLGHVSEGLRGPTAIDLDTDGNLYVADSRSHTVVKFDKYDNKVAVLSGAKASGAGLAVASDGKVYVSEGDKVAILDPAGALLGYLGQGAGEFIYAGDIDFDINGNIYVVDQTAGRIEVFAPGATSGATFISQSFGGSIGLSINTNTNQVYIANYSIDAAAGIVPSLYVYDAGGVLLKTIPASNGFGTTLFSFGDVTFDAAGNYYVSDSSVGTIRVMDVATDAPLLSYGFGELNHPGSMAFDGASGRLYVLYGDRRVDTYGVAGGTTPVKANAVPTVPVSITVGEVSSLTPSLLFDNATDADGDVLTYNLRVLDAAGSEVVGFGVAEGAGPTVAPVAQPLVENATYSWQVQADDGQTASAWSAPKPIYINATQEAPSAPELLSFVNGESAGSDAVLIWGASADADPFASLSYRVEIFSGASLVASAATTAVSSVVLDYADLLTPGATYGWQVVAVDNTDRETASINSGRFVFQTSVLTVASSVDGAKVYLGGHHGYAGRYLGVAPVSVRGLAPADYSVVVEAAGFEPFVTAVTLARDAQVEVLASLDAASLADSFDIRDLNLNGQAVAGIDVSPIVADLDRDGILDLLLANNGFIDFYKGSLVVGPQAADSIEYTAVVLPGAPALPTNKLVFETAVQRLVLPQVLGASPLLVDWNNDDRLDLLIGGADGSVKLFLGQGGLDFSATGDWLVTVAASASPAVGDFDGDGDKDLIVSSGGELLLFDNVGTDASPVLNTQVVIARLTAPVAPLFMDWDADGTRELMLLTQGELLRAVVVDGLVVSLETTGLTVAGAESVFAVNFAARNYNDLVFGTNGGSLVVANGQQGTLSPAYVQVMFSKLADLRLLILDQAPGFVAKTDSIEALLGQADYAAAGTSAVQLITELQYASGAWTAAVDFAGMLDSGAAAQAADQAAADQAAADQAAADQAAADHDDDHHDDQGDDQNDDKQNKSSKKDKKSKKEMKH